MPKIKKTKRWYDLHPEDKRPPTKAQLKQMAKRPTRGKPAHEPTEQSRNSVSMMSAFGLYKYECAKILGIDHDTFTKYYNEDYELGTAKAIASVGAKLYKTAVSDRPNALQAQQFFLSRRGKGLWSEVKQMEVSGPNGGAIPVQRFDLTQLPPEELDQLESYIDAIVIGEDQDDD